ncbi:MAG: hypothetical protein SGARI_002014 [Bacillariaceae sp.]
MPSQEIRLPNKGDEVLARKLNLSQGTFAFKEIEMCDGIAFGSQPTTAHKIMYVIRQLGYGLSGACCFACTEATAAPCVVKFFRKGLSIDAAQNEANNWQHVYKEYGFNFVQATETPRVLLERQKLVEGEEESLLYRALRHIADKECIHKEVFWHHVGLVDVSTENQTARETAVLCDLQHIVRCEDALKRNAWVQGTFASMKQRM